MEVTPPRYPGTGAGVDNRAHRREVAVSIFLFALGLASFVLYARALGMEEARLIATSVVFLLLFLPYPVLSVRRWAGHLATWVLAAPGLWATLFLSLPLIVYLGYAGTTGTLDLSFLWKYGLYAGLPLWLMTSGLKTAGLGPHSWGC
jgi:hypothetical protein